MKKILDWKKYIQAAREVVSEGCVLLKNEDSILPLKKGQNVAVFGRIQHNYYKSGTGSGGMVNATEVTGILDGLKLSGKVNIDSAVENTYLEWEKENPFEEGLGWGQEPWSQKEMPVSKELALTAAERNDTALIIIGRTAGEDKDNLKTEGSWFLTEEEKSMLQTVSSAFKNTAVILNTGNIIDMNFVKDYGIKAVLYAWQGGMTGGLGISDVLTGEVSPSGKLTDTIACNIEDYPSADNFGSLETNKYEEDIFVGYRYFESFAKDKVLYPFGFGLSYTDFCITSDFFEFDAGKKIPEISLDITVKNTGSFSGKETVQIYVKQPQGKLGKPAVVLADFLKTKLLKSGKSQKLSFNFNVSRFRSFDDTGITGHNNCFVIEAGLYEIYAGSNVRDVFKVGEFSIENTIVLEKVCDALRPVEKLERLKAAGIDGATGKIKLEKEVILPASLYQNIHRNENLNQVENFLAQKDLNQETVKILKTLSDEDLSCIVRGEGMGSPKVTPGTAAAFGGISKSLTDKGIPCGCCTDGPSGLRLDSGAQAFSLPNGTLQACTFNPELVKKLYSFLGLELVYNKIDIILGPGINIHRHPLNGRNFEYFSEDPFVTGIFASANILGLKEAGVTGSLKHFCCNNQEKGRRSSNSVVSARALREIYLPGFEMAVKNGADVIMTSYGAVNNMWTSGSYDLNTLILRKDWGFKGIVMTDWWASTNNEGEKPEDYNIAQNVRAQNDIFMVVPDAAENTHGDNILESLSKGALSKDELLRCAYNIIEFLKKSHAWLRMENKDIKVKIKNRKETPMDSYADEIVYYDVEDGLTIPLENTVTARGNSFGFGLVSKERKTYRLELTGKTGDNELAQINVSVSFNGVNVATLCWNGTHGEYVSQGITTKWPLNRYTVVNLFFAQSGLTLKEFKITEIQE